MQPIACTLPLLRQSRGCALDRRPPITQFSRLLTGRMLVVLAPICVVRRLKPREPALGDTAPQLEHTLRFLKLPLIEHYAPIQPGPLPR